MWACTYESRLLRQRIRVLREARGGSVRFCLEAHAELQALRDHLHLLAQLSAPEAQNADDLILTRNGLAHCFTHLADTADTADHIVAAVTA
jgi:hypothetical protein